MGHCHRYSKRATKTDGPPATTLHPKEMLISCTCSDDDDEHVVAMISLPDEDVDGAGADKADDDDDSEGDGDDDEDDDDAGGGGDDDSPRRHQRSHRHVDSKAEGFMVCIGVEFAQPRNGVWRSAQDPRAKTPFDLESRGGFFYDYLLKKLPCSSVSDNDVDCANISTSTLLFVARMTTAAISTFAKETTAHGSLPSPATRKLRQRDSPNQTLMKCPRVA